MVLGNKIIRIIICAFVFSACGGGGEETTNADNGVAIPNFDSGSGDDASDKCKTNDDCSGGEGCKDGACMAFCSDEVPCAGDSNCIDGYCYPQCKEHKDCKGGQLCKDGKCVAASGNDGGDNDAGDGGEGECTCSIFGAEYECVGVECYFERCKDNYHNLNGTLGDGCEYFCEPSNGKVEICDNTDNDCNGVIDDLPDFATNIEHCGDCNTTCVAGEHSTAKCQNKRCSLVCEEGFYDNDGIAENGCEGEKCEPSNGGIEKCDGLDNNCDGTIDEGFEKNSINSCGNGCVDCTKEIPANHDIKCENGTCTDYGCLAGWIDADGDPKNGCETVCYPTNPPTELCDGADNDCDPKTPDGSGDPVIGQACQTGFAGECASGVLICDLTRGYAKCKASNAVAEVCNGYDDDCNGYVDDNAPCTGTNKCVQGVCKDTSCSDECTPAGDTCKDDATIQHCSDTDSDGCNEKSEEGCGSGKKCQGGVCIEVCVPNCSSRECGSDGCGGNCGNCTSAPSATCTSSNTLRTYASPGSCSTSYQCTYNYGDQTCPYGCDSGACKNCPAATCTSLGKQCGTWADGCGGTVTCPACAGGYNCNDGTCVPNNPCPSEMVYISENFDHTFCIDKYEASRQDATDTNAGTDEDGAPKSVVGVLPWDINQSGIVSGICQRASKRICTTNEWIRACKGKSGYKYSYGNTYQAHTCNIKVTGEPLGAREKTGNRANCHSDEGVYDMMGNVSELIARLYGYSWADSDINDYYCERSDKWYTSSTINRGFRCCKDM